MCALIAAVAFGCAPIHTELFDEEALPTVTLDDLERFSDPLLAIRNGANCGVIFAELKALELRWWDMGGRQAEFKERVEYLRWAAECWRRLDVAANCRCGEIYRTECLSWLRKHLGPQMYYAGVMPANPGQWILIAEPLGMTRETGQ